jgi:hypothetical protein
LITDYETRAEKLIMIGTTATISQNCWFTIPLIGGGVGGISA